MKLSEVIAEIDAARLSLGLTNFLGGETMLVDELVPVIWAALTDEEKQIWNHAESELEITMNLGFSPEDIEIRSQALVRYRDVMIALAKAAAMRIHSNRTKRELQEQAWIRERENSPDA